MADGCASRASLDYIGSLKIKHEGSGGRRKEEQEEEEKGREKRSGVDLRASWNPGVSVQCGGQHGAGAQGDI